MKCFGTLISGAVSKNMKATAQGFKTFHTHVAKPLESASTISLIYTQALAPTRAWVRGYIRCSIIGLSTKDTAKNVRTKLM